MNKLVLPILLVALAIGGLAWLWVDSGSSDIDMTDPLQDPSVHTREDLRGGGNPTRRRDPNREDPGSRDPGRVVAKAEIIVHGRCVDLATERPLSGCRVDVAATSRRFAQRRTEQEPTDRAPPAVTDSSGRFRISLELPAGHVIRVTTGMPGRADMRGFVAASGNVVDVGDILIPFGSRLEAEVVDEQGLPQPEISLRLYRTITGSNPKIAAMNWINEVSDTTGFLQTEALLASGTWRVTASQNIRVMKPAGTFEIPVHGSVYRTKIVVRLPDPKAMIIGTVSNEDGDPIRNIAVHARDDSRWPIGYGTTDQKGVFRVRCRTTPGEPVKLSVPRAVGYETLETTEKYKWGTKGVQLTLRRAGDLPIRVVEAGTGTPVLRYRISWAKANDVGSGYQGSRGKMQNHPDGKTTIKGVPSGVIRIVAIPDGRDLAPNDPIEFQNTSGSSELRIDLNPRFDLPVIVKTRNGSPIAGSLLRLVRSLGNVPVTLSGYSVDHAQLPQFRDNKNHELLLDNATTNRSGQATLRWEASADALGIRVLGPGHVPLVHQPVTVGTSNEELEIIVTGGASVSGTVRPLAILNVLRPDVTNSRLRTQAPMIILTYSGQDGPRGAQRTKSVPIDEDGRFQVAGLHPGRWDVVFRVWRFGGGRRSNIVHKNFDSIDIGEGESRRLDVYIDDLRPSTLTGQVIVNGDLFVRGSVHLIRGTKKENRFVPAADTILTTDQQGEFSATDIQPGLYRVGVDLQTKGNVRTTRLVSQDPTEIGPGETTRRVFRIESGILRVLLRNRAGAPVTNRYIAVRHKTNGHKTGGETNDAGLMEINPISTGTFTIGVYKPVQTEPGRRRAPKQGSVKILGEVTILAGRMPSSTTVTLPESYEESKRDPRGNRIR